MQVDEKWKNGYFDCIEISSKNAFLAGFQSQFVNPIIRALLTLSFFC